MDKEKWIKYGIIGACTFLGAFLAFYFVADQTAKRIFIHPTHSMQMPKQAVAPFEGIEDFLREEERTMENFRRSAFNNPATIESYTNEDEYKIIIDLSKFDNNPENINIDIDDNRVNVFGKSIVKKGGNTTNYSFEQHFVLPHDINETFVTKEKKGNKYIITLPFEN